MTIKLVLDPLPCLAFATSQPCTATVYPGCPGTQLQPGQTQGTVPVTRREANTRFPEAGDLGTVPKNVVSTYRLGGPSLTI